MVRIEIECDRCGTTITADRSKLVIESGSMRAQLANSGSEPAIDLCRGCAGAFSGWLRDGLEASKAPTEPTHF